MKNIILTLVFTTTILGCTNNKESTEEETAIPQELIGAWQFKGIYSHDGLDENRNPLYTPYENGDIITFNSDKTFTHLLQSYQYTGTFAVINGEKINFRYYPNPNGINNIGSSKISLLTENELRLTCLNDVPCDVIRYEKIVSD